jgi:hypothetical protein
LTDKKLLIGSSFCGHNEGNNPNVSPEVFEDGWMKDEWSGFIELYLFRPKYFIYHSNCDRIGCDRDFGESLSRNGEVVWATHYVKERDHRFDYHGALLMCAMYAYANDLDLLWIEQDCIVYRLDEVVRYCQQVGMENGKLIYGYGEKVSLHPNWAEQSLIYIPHRFTGEAIKRMIEADIQRKTNPVPEITFHSYFGDCYHFPFGFGRVRPDGWEKTEEPFFIQQPTQKELDIMRKKILN